MERNGKTQRGRARAAQRPDIALNRPARQRDGLRSEHDGRGGEGDGYGRRSAQHQCHGMGVGHLDTFHLPGYADGPFFVTNSDDTCMSQLWTKFGMICVYFWIHKCIVGIIHVCLRSINGSGRLSFGKIRTWFGEFRTNFIMIAMTSSKLHNQSLITYVSGIYLGVSRLYEPTVHLHLYTERRRRNDLTDDGPVSVVLCRDRAGPSRRSAPAHSLIYTFDYTSSLLTETPEWSSRL